MASLEGTRVALELADRLDDDDLRFEALVQLYVLGGMVGDAEASAYAARACDLATASGDARRLREANILVSGMLLDSGDIDAARALLEHEYREWQERDELFSAQVLWRLSWIELWGGRWELAAEHATRARDVSVQYGVEKSQDYIPITWVAAHRGQLEVAQEESERALKLCEETIGFHPPLLQAVPGLVALWRGDAATAADRLGEADRQATVLGWGASEAPVDGPLRRSFARARQDRRRDSRHRPMGGGRNAAWPSPGACRCNPVPRSCRRCSRERRPCRSPPPAGYRPAQGGRRSVRTGSGAARTRDRSAAGAAEACRPRGDRGCALRLRAARGPDLGREGAQRARGDWWAHT